MKNSILEEKGSMWRMHVVLLFISIHSLPRKETSPDLGVKAGRPPEEVKDCFTSHQATPSKLTWTPFGRVNFSFGLCLCGFRECDFPLHSVAPNRLVPQNQKGI